VLNFCIYDLFVLFIICSWFLKSSTFSGFVLGFLSTFFSVVDKPINDSSEKNKDKDDKPAWGDESERFFNVIFVAEVDFLLDTEDAEKRRVFPDFFVIEGSVGNDGVDDGIVLVGINFFVRKEWINSESVFCLSVNVARIDDERAGFYRLIEVEGADVVFYDGALDASSAFDCTIK